MSPWASRSIDKKLRVRKKAVLKLAASMPLRLWQREALGALPGAHTDVRDGPRNAPQCFQHAFKLRQDFFVFAVVGHEPCRC